MYKEARKRGIRICKLHMSHKLHTGRTNLARQRYTATVYDSYDIIARARMCEDRAFQANENDRSR